jgi:hypothetical protein
MENKSFALAGNQASIPRSFSPLDIYGTDHDILARYVPMCGYILPKLRDLETF